VTDKQLTIWKRRVANLCVAAGPLLVFFAALSAGLPTWTQMVIGAVGVTVVWVAKNWQSALDVEAAAK